MSFPESVKKIGPNWIVRITADCPLMDPVLVDQIIEVTQKSNADYGANTLEETFPDGQDVEVFTFDALKKAWERARLKSEREHVTPFIRNNSDFIQKDNYLFKVLNYSNDKNYSHIRITVDEANDFDLVAKLIQDLGEMKTWKEYTDYIIDNKLNKINAGILRNEGYKKSPQRDNEK